MINFSAPPNWVRLRADCNLELTFEALLQIVKRDVDEANKLKLNDREFSFHVDENGITPIAQVTQAKPLTSARSPFVRFELETHLIRAIGTGVRFYVRAEWNEEQAACKLYVDDQNEAYELWEISQKALIRMFFG